MFTYPLILKPTKLIILVIGLCLVPFLSFGQNQGIKSMRVFLQKNADSTLVFSYTSNWMRALNYLVVSKKGDTITLYRYASEFNRKIDMPRKIKDSLTRLNRDHNDASGGINHYFNPKYIDKKTAKNLWAALLKQQPWAINDDKIDGEGCPIDQNPNGKGISDAGGISLTLITKDEIRPLSFYAPSFYHKICPRKGRTAILKITKLLSPFLKESDD